MTERVTLGNLHLRLKALEERLDRLFAPPPDIHGRYEQRAPLEIIPITGLFTVESRGPKWFCISPEGVKVNERGTTKEDAQELADQMNGVTKSMRVA
jgi:hypothetical protein